GFSFSPNGSIYILSAEGKLRKNLNISSGLTTFVGTNLNGITSNLSLEFDDSGTLWTMDQCCSGKLHKLSTITGVDIYDSPQSVNQVFPSELDFSNGKLYGISIFDESTSTVTTFYTVNTSTGSTSNLFTLPGIYFGLAGHVRKMYPDTVYITKYDTVVVTKVHTVTVISFVTVTGLNTGEESEDSDIKAYPNPTTNKLSVTSESGNVYSVELIDSKGTLVMTSYTPSSIEVGDKAKGIYLLKAKSYKGAVLKTFKVMIE
ncbi:MAG: T9SS type A sorting domain-containing protein, partial [Cytophagales bacterium]|nr:T9SS type A sorting domain-containing protein [Cytophagales bacterium]